VPLAYYSRAATAEFWSEHWGGQSIEALLRIARVSPLTAIIERHLPRGGCVLEAGCGVGQYVLLLRERGWRAVGVDWSMEATAQGARAGAPLAAMDLRRLAMRDGAAAAYLSLGVVEHDPDGPDAIVAEAARVLAPGGTILLSVPCAGPAASSTSSPLPGGRSGPSSSAAVSSCAASTPTTRPASCARHCRPWSLGG